MAKLKPCPFCGGEGKLKKGFPSQQKTGQRMAFVQCSKCMAKTQTFYQMPFERWDSVIQQAIKAWDGRAGDPDGTD